MLNTQTPVVEHMGREVVIGLDLGGTKCAVSVLEHGRVREVLRIPTGQFAPTFELLFNAIKSVEVAGSSVMIGVSCGGPLDSVKGIILSPPNLHPSWYRVAIVDQLMARFDGRACLMNDANCCALAEWKFGAGRGTQHMVFLTSGTGMGGGLILNGQLYEGATGDAGEIGHVRLSADGPVGYGKIGSVEGFCSGGGIARLAERWVGESIEPKPSWAQGTITAKQVAEAARAGEPLARRIMAESGTRFGEALAILIDLFNPERIVLGGLFPAARDLLEPTLNAAVEREALPIPRGACQILPAELGETIGSHGAVAAALYYLERNPA